MRSETSSFALRGKLRNLREAGKQLDVEYILEGSVLREGRQVRIHVQLVRVHDDFPVWSGQFHRAMTDIFAIQDEISRGIVNPSVLENRSRRHRRLAAAIGAFQQHASGRPGLATPETLGLEGELAFLQLLYRRRPSLR